MTIQDCTPLDRNSDLALAYDAQWQMKQRAQAAHAICAKLSRTFKGIIALDDDGELHNAIHSILAVDTPHAKSI